MIMGLHMLRKIQAAVGIVVVVFGAALVLYGLYPLTVVVVRNNDPFDRVVEVCIDEQCRTYHLDSESSVWHIELTEGDGSVGIIGQEDLQHYRPARHFCVFFFDFDGRCALNSYYEHGLVLIFLGTIILAVGVALVVSFFRRTSRIS